MTSVKLMKWLMVAAVLLAAAGCGNEVNRAVSAEVRVEQGALRARADAKRDRLWVLGLDDLRVYDSAGKRLIRKIELPGWSVARFICNPDLALDRAGGAVISSNVQSRFWRVNGDTFEVKEEVILLREREGWDMGFGALAFAPDGSLLALAANAGSLWKINGSGSHASLVETYHSPLKACTVPTRRSR
jgi:hypothetical protein